MKKLLYFASINWDWIKQRPQFIAENLSDSVELHYVEEKRIKNLFHNHSKEKRPSNIVFKKYFRLPLYNPIKRNSYKIFDFINRCLMCLFLRIKQYDYIWVSSIVSYSHMERLLPKHTKLIYDCMDDELEFPHVCNNSHARKMLAEYEIKLINRADYVICSAENLKQLIISRTKINRHIHVINNATVFPEKSNKLEYRDKFKIDRSKHSILYIGTIAKWIDFNSIIELLNYDSQLICYFIGPLDTNLIKHDRIVHLGRCLHSEIWGIMKQTDVLIMPFVLNPLIESVNPVKLYEYIWAERPIIATRYKETMKFDDYCYLYSSKEEIVEIYKTLLSDKFLPKQKDKLLLENFINQNTWSSRCDEIKNICFKD